MRVLPNEIIKGINKMSYDLKGEERVSVKASILYTLADELKRLDEENKALKKQLNVEKSEVKRLTGKLLECQNKQVVNFDRYI